MYQTRDKWDWTWTECHSHIRQELVLIGKLVRLYIDQSPGCL